MTNNRPVNQAGWVSFPIILLLFGVAGAGVQFQRQLMASYEWRLLFQQGQETGQLLAPFRQAFVQTPSFSKASRSRCRGFCSLETDLSEQKEWRQGTVSYGYQWQYYQAEANPALFYRMCVSYNTRQYFCWWWRNQKRYTQGWLVK